MTDVPETQQPKPERGRVTAQGTEDRTIPSTCHPHSSGRGFCNLRVSKVGGDIVLDPHVAGSCVITLDEDGAVAMRDVLIEWLG